jgi:peptidoglycan/xylan/chitin deacetylase (PgdA/CDA1 family)
MSRRALFVSSLALLTGLVACAPHRNPTTANRAGALVPATVRPVPVHPPAPAAVFPDLARIRARFERRLPDQWGIHVAGVTNRLPDDRGADRVALTFDACGGSGSLDRKLIDRLIRDEVPATLFLNRRWIDADPGRATALADVPWFELANHGTLHRPLSVTGASAYGITGTGSVDGVIEEVWSNQLRLAEVTGRFAGWFRSGTAHYDDVATQIVAALGLRVAGFTVNGDGGATFSAETVLREVDRVEGRGIVLAHMNRPGSGTARGFAEAIPVLRDRGLILSTLS